MFIPQAGRQNFSSVYAFVLSAASNFIIGSMSVCVTVRRFICYFFVTLQVCLYPLSNLLFMSPIVFNEWQHEDIFSIIFSLTIFSSWTSPVRIRICYMQLVTKSASVLLYLTISSIPLVCFISLYFYF